MGICTSQSQQSLTQFKSQPIILRRLQMLHKFDKTRQDNLKQYKQQAPSLNYACKSDYIPKLYDKLYTSRSTQLETNVEPFNSNSLSKEGLLGVALPVFYIPKFNAYYEGDWKMGFPHGQGKLYFKDGTLYQGFFVHGQINGQDGIYFFPDGSVKRGTIKSGKMQGYGIFYAYKGRFRYEGQWIDDKPNGKGKQIYADGSIYEGGFVNGLKHDDNGIYKWANGKVYIGQFRNGYMEGNGKLFMPNRKGEYIGQFSQNLIVGHGKMKTQKGQYEGTFQNGQMQGKGTFRWYDKKVYEGEFMEGKLHGKGKMYFPNGQLVEGIWHYGQSLKLQAIKSGVSKLNLQKKYSAKQ